MTTTWTYREYEAGGGYLYNDVLRLYDTEGVLYDYEDAPTTFSYQTKN